MNLVLEGLEGASVKIPLSLNRGMLLVSFEQDCDIHTTYFILIILFIYFY